jgi:hypothetical protein
MKHMSVIPAVVVGIGLTSLSAQQGTALKAVALPESVRLSEVAIQWQSGGGDGCAGDCSNYFIIIRGDGLVTLKDLGWGDRPARFATRQRSIPADSVVALLDAFLKARFFESPDNFKNRSVAIRKGDTLFLNSSVGGVGAGWVDMTVRLGTVTKTVRLGGETPTDLARLRDRIFEIGGPKAPWPVH